MFADRQDAGRRLAERLHHLAVQQPVVLGLPRGGVPVAAVIAETLHAPLDVLVVRKVGAPMQPELAVGAVTDSDSPVFVRNEDVIRKLGIDEAYLSDAVRREHEEVVRRQTMYRSGRAPIDVAGRTVIVVDDGIATGASVRAGLQTLRHRAPRALVLAVPVGPPETFNAIREEVDELVFVQAPPDFFAVGQAYQDFAQTSDDEVIRLLNDATQRSGNG